MIGRLVYLFRLLFVKPQFEEYRIEQQLSEIYHLRGQTWKVQERIKELKEKYPEYVYKTTINFLHPVGSDGLEGEVQINKPL